MAQDENAIRKTPSTRQTLEATKIPAWLYKQFIQEGYRQPDVPTIVCLKSLLFLHNETINIYSHLVPAAIIGFFALTGHIDRYWHERYPSASPPDKVAMLAYVATSILCLGISALYHTLNCHSRSLSRLWNRLDYAAIILQTVGSFGSGIYIIFYCMPHLQKLYWTMTGVLGLVSTYLVAFSHFQEKSKKFRVATFVAMGLSGLLPVVHAILIFPLEGLMQRAAVGYYLVEGLVLLLGTGFYITRFPESWNPGRFDIWGASHQIFHFLVVISFLIHIRGLLQAFDWIDRNPRAPSCTCPSWPLDHPTEAYDVAACCIPRGRLGRRTSRNGTEGGECTAALRWMMRSRARIGRLWTDSIGIHHGYTGVGADGGRMVRFGASFHVPAGYVST